MHMDYACPKCRGPVEAAPDAWLCRACARRYPVVCGIPDFRLAPDPYISFDDEYRKAERIARAAETLGFAELVRYYWSITPDVPAPQVDRYVAYAVAGEARGSACLESMDATLGARWQGAALLEVGCGTGGLLVPAAARFGRVVGSDIALRWLVIAQKRLAECGANAQLVCCSADRLPFAAGTFDALAGLHVLEHSEDPAAVLAESARVLQPGGHCLFPTPNRYSLGPEPCVRVWGVGFLPRRWMSGYVKWLRGVPYRHIRLLSSFELGRFLRAAGFARYGIEPQRFAACELAAASPLLRALARAYHLLLRVPGMAILMRLVGPMHQVWATR